MKYGKCVTSKVPVLIKVIMPCFIGSLLSFINSFTVFDSIADSLDVEALEQELGKWNRVT